jgi:stalled ribosome rescue protein Dom34
MRDYMAKVKRRNSYRRGYPVALLAGFGRDQAMLWEVFSHVVKLNRTINLSGSRTDGKQLYNFHESVIAALRPLLEEGIRSIIVTSPMSTTYAADFLSHVRKHHKYMTQSKGSKTVVFAELAGFATDLHAVNDLVKTQKFHEAIGDTTSEESDRILAELEKQLYNNKSESIVLFSLEEVEKNVYDRQNEHNDRDMNHLILTDEYLANSYNKNRIQRLLQISKNKKVKVRIVDARTSTGKRIRQLGGLVFFIASSKQTPARSK